MAKRSAKRRRRRGGLQWPKPLDSIRCPITIRRFLAMVERIDSSTWRWTGTKDAKGYGRFRLDGSCLAAHRIAYAIFRGPIPDGFVVHHVSSDPSNVHPDNLQLVTVDENTAFSNARHQRQSSDDIPI